mmetsp:Transcript_22682/g.67993  ORF Transcript_22682/g.67993 Transcript_22682/m.67993 type:complete len:218 (-) Transcript_22682:158-811(-)
MGAHLGLLHRRRAVRHVLDKKELGPLADDGPPVVDREAPEPRPHADAVFQLRLEIREPAGPGRLQLERLARRAVLGDDERLALRVVHDAVPRLGDRVLDRERLLPAAAAREVRHLGPRARRVQPEAAARAGAGARRVPNQTQSLAFALRALPRLRRLRHHLGHGFTPLRRCRRLLCALCFALLVFYAPSSARVSPRNGAWTPGCGEAKTAAAVCRDR